MLRQFALFFLLIMIGAPAMAVDLYLAENGKTTYAIVIDPAAVAQPDAHNAANRCDAAHPALRCGG